MDDPDDYISVTNTTENHQKSEGTSIRESLHYKRKTAQDLSFLQTHKLMFKQYMTPKVIVLLWIWFGVQFGLAPFLGIEIGSDAWSNLFLLSEDNFFSIALFTSMIGHGSLPHVAINTFVLYGFGIKAEQVLDSYQYSIFFILSGVIAFVAQLWVVSTFLTGSFPPLVGASGAIAGIIGLVAVKNPDDTVYFLFVIPMKMWMGILLFILGSFGVVLIWGIGAGGFAHTAHAVGAIFGVIVGLVHPKSTNGKISLDISSMY